jgi:hypothetical protein
MLVHDASMACVSTNAPAPKIKSERVDAVEAVVSTRRDARHLVATRHGAARSDREGIRRSLAIRSSGWGGCTAAHPGCGPTCDKAGGRLAVSVWLVVCLMLGWVCAQCHRVHS